MSVTVNVSALTRLAKRQIAAADRIEPIVEAIVVKNGALLARVARANTPLSSGRHDERGESGHHLRDDIAAIPFKADGAHAVVVGAVTERGRMIGAFIEFGTDPHEIAPRDDGPGYLWWPERGRVAPTHKTYPASSEYSSSDDQGRIHEAVQHPGTSPNPVMMDALLTVTPKFEAEVIAAGLKVAR